MKILYLSQYFPPEVGATQTRSFEMARHLVDFGHQVSVITEVPNHPSGRIKPGYRGTLIRRARLEGIDVTYVRILPFVKKTVGRRVVFYLSYALSATVAGLLRGRPRYDLLYATSPPLPVGLAALMLARARRLPLFFEVRDLWPASAVALGLLHDRRAIRLSELLEVACYRAACRIIVVTEGMQQTLRQRGIPATKLALVPNGTNVNVFQASRDEADRLRSVLGLEGKVVLVYAGILGVAQGLEVVLQAARALAAEPRYHFLLLGAGPEAETLRQQAAQLGLANVTFLGEIQRQSMPLYYACADAAIVPLKPNALFRQARPTKMFDAWACETPVILGVEGEARDLLAQARGGCSYAPGDPTDLVRAIREIDLMGPATRREMGRAARAYVVDHHSRERYARDLERLLVTTVTPHDPQC